MKQYFVFAGLIGFLGSILAIVAGYVDYGLLDISFRYALEPVWKWPIFGMSFVLTTLSLFVPFVAHHFRTTESPEMSIVIYAFAYLWLPFFIFYPGLRALGVTSDGVAPFAWFGVCVSQYLTARIMLKAIRAQVARAT